MFHSLRKLRRMPIRATDGKIGELLGFFFDENAWQIRCLVADTGHWLSGRKVLIAADLFRPPSAWEEGFHVDVTRDQIRNGPVLSKTESTLGETGHVSAFDYSILDRAGEFSLLGPEPRIIGAFDPRQLRSTDEVRGYTIRAADGDFGHLADFIFDDESWTIRYLVIDTGGWWPGRKVLLSPEWIESVRWHDNKVCVSVTRESIKTAPEYDPFGPPTRDYEEELFDHYQRPKYWIVPEALREAGFGRTEDRQRT